MGCLTNVLVDMGRQFKTPGWMFLIRGFDSLRGYCLMKGFLMSKCVKCHGKEAVYKETKECRSCYNKRCYNEKKRSFELWKLEREFRMKGLLL